MYTSYNQTVTLRLDKTEKKYLVFSFFFLLLRRRKTTKNTPPYFLQEEKWKNWKKNVSKHTNTLYVYTTTWSLYFILIFPTNFLWLFLDQPDLSLIILFFLTLHFFCFCCCWCCFSSSSYDFRLEKRFRFVFVVHFHRGKWKTSRY